MTQWDDEKLNTIIDILKNKYNIRSELIKKEWFLLIDRETYKKTVTESISEEQYEKYPIIHNPDIMVADGNYIEFIIELDGSIHDTKPGQRKTHKRNEHYYYNNIPYLVLNEKNIELMGSNWLVEIEKWINKKELTHPDEYLLA